MISSALDAPEKGTIWKSPLWRVRTSHDLESLMSPRSADTDAFWQAFRHYAGLDHDNYVVGSFGDSPEMATELAG
jgi:hypothetical protein